MSILTSRVEQFDFSFQPSIDRKVVREFSVPLPSVLTTVGHRCSSARHSTRALPPWLALVPEEFASPSPHLKPSSPWLATRSWIKLPHEFRSRASFSLVSGSQCELFKAVTARTFARRFRPSSH